MKTDINKVKASYKGLLNKNKTITSPTYKLIKADMRRWLKNTALFFSLGVVLFLSALQRGETLEQAGSVFYYWLLSSLIDLIRKFLTENTYKPVDEIGESK